ncbi:protein kinase [Nonomuraea sp. B12E4]|uniref:protein kinase domain-containing protein n=1 Tax=Nonomuraea sp. B12E4 TaxID=3153564 RepID=UPI00325F581A
MIGKHVAGRFVIEAPLGSGGMARVWRGRDRKLNRLVALKQVRADAGRLPELAARAAVEAEALARIDHPGIVRIYDVLDQPDGPWIVMDYVEGDVLGTRIEREPLSESAVVEIGAQALDALAAAHAEGVFHRDVKPENILIAPSGAVVLVDFGIAAIEGHERITVLGQVIGTPDFIAPERLRGAPAGAAADLWSLGATLYTALEGRPPFRRSSEEATRFAILTFPPDPMTRPGRLKPTIDRLLVKSPANRMGAEELAQRLARAARRDPRMGPRWTPPPPGFATRPPSRPVVNGTGTTSGGSGTGAVSGRGGGAGAGAGVGDGGAARRAIAGVSALERGSMVLAMPAADAAVLLARHWQLFTTAAVEQMCREPARSAKILQMLLPTRAGWLLDQVRDPGLVAKVVLAMDTHHHGRVLGHMQDRQSAAAIAAMTTLDSRRTGRAVAAMPEDPAVQALSRLSPDTIAGVLAHCPPARRDRLLPRLPDETREEVEWRLAAGA